MRARVQAVLIVIVFSVGLTACPSPNKVGCGTPSEELVARLRAGIPEEGTFRNPRTYAVEGDPHTFVSVEHRTSEEVKDDNSGDIFTFVVDNADSSSVLAVDERARKESNFEHADFDVRKKGALESRGCVYSTR